MKEWAIHDMLLEFLADINAMFLLFLGQQPGDELGSNTAYV